MGLDLSWRRSFLDLVACTIRSFFRSVADSAADADTSLDALANYARIYVNCF